MNFTLIVSYALIFLGMIPSLMSEKIRLNSYWVRRRYYLAAILANLAGITLLTINFIIK